MSQLLFDKNGVLTNEFDDDVSLVAYSFENIQRVKIKNKLFYKLYMDSVSLFTNKYIKQCVFITLFRLISLMDFKNEFVCINGIPANINQLCKHFQITNKTLYNHLKKLEELEIIKKIRKGRNTNILINPYFISLGKDSTNEALRIFGSSKWAKSNYYSKRRKKGNDF